MSAIDEDLASKIFDGIEKVREGLPYATKLAELVDPKDVLLIEGLSLGLGKLFELIVSLKAHDTIDLAAETLRKETLDEWKQAGK